MAESTTTDAIIRFEGYELPALMTADDIAAIVGGMVARRTVVAWFTSGQLRGFKLGKGWVIRASRFVEDWTALENGTPPQRRIAASRRVRPVLTPRVLRSPSAVRARVERDETEAA